MAKSIGPFLMYAAGAEAAADFYCSVFSDAAILSLDKWTDADPGPSGGIKRGLMRIGGEEIMFIDSPSPHEFDFTPSFSFFVECADETELDAAFAALSADGNVKMPPDNYGFSKKFTWIEDRWGVSWQLNYNAN